MSGVSSSSSAASGLGILFDYQFRVIVVGDSTVGKSSLLRYFTDARVEDTSEPTIGADFFSRLLELHPDNVRVKLQLWDTAGQERFRSITKSYYRNSVGVLLVYDITKRDSFDHLRDWFDDVSNHVDPKAAVFMVIGHKADTAMRDRAVTSQEAKNFADANGFGFFETSAVTGQNIEDAFLALTQDIYALVNAGTISAEEGFGGIQNGSFRSIESFEEEVDSKAQKKCC